MRDLLLYQTMAGTGAQGPFCTPVPQPVLKPDSSSLSWGSTLYLLLLDLCGSCQFISPACHCPSEEQSCPLAHRLLQALYHPQTGQQKELS